MDHSLSRRAALSLFAAVVLSWGLNWAVTKILVQDVAPFWATAIRSGIGSLVLLLVLLARGQFNIPCRRDVPVILSIGLLHMTAFAVLVAFGVRLMPVGRSIVLGYTTPLWVAPGAWLFLREPITPRRLAGVALGLGGLMVMFNPLAFDWNDRNALTGSALILFAAICWAANILYVRAHVWVSSPFQLSFWQALLATVVLSILALAVDGVPHIVWSERVTAAFLYSGVFGIALAYWAMAVVNRSLPATTTSLGILATPVIGVITSSLALGETIDITLLVAMAMILSGIAVGTIPTMRRTAIPAPQASVESVVRP